MPKSVPSLERRQRERVQTRQKILDAARRMFVQRGYEATTMRAIAAKIGYTPTAIYHHFEDKQALVAELSALDFRAFAQALRDIGAESDPVERLRKTGRAYVAFGVANPMHYQFLFMTRRPTGSPTRTGQGDPGADAYGFLRHTCADTIAAGRLRPEFTDADEVAQIAWGAVHGLVALHIAKADDPWIPWRDVSETAAKACDALIRGLVREPAS
jgi:AcrR family transcriptional regulator